MARPPSRGRRAPPPTSSRLLDELGLAGLSWQVVGLTAAVLALGFGPMLLASLLGTRGAAYGALVALGPGLVCLAFAALTWRYGMRHAAATGRSKLEIWLLVAMFVTLAALTWWGLFASVGSAAT
ncbi:hypothetical protein F8S13_03425 [Chloroflexia bacterium SDU3-3]|nr:hypothetical protein F8S13_03425 [Chloroflexia bacterium SDU3-3]